MTTTNAATISVDPTAPPPPPPQQPPRSSFSCDRHPEEQFTGFCPSCLCERLHTLDTSSSNTPSSSRRPSSASVAIKALFSSTSKGNNSNCSIFPPPAPIPKPSSKESKPSSILPELRRTKSFSASKNEALGLIYEPQRKSCDVRVRNNVSLWSLFTIDDQSKSVANNNNNKSTSVCAAAASINQISKRVESNAGNELEDEEEFRDCRNTEDCISLVDEDGDEIRPVPDSHLEGLRSEINGEILEEEKITEGSDLKSMKDHIGFDTQAIKKSSGGKFWGAASVFSKKWNKWRQKQKDKKQNNGEKLATLPVEKPIWRQYRDTQSEIADYGYGRRSCDVDPRFSLDAGRISFDDPRYSFEEPRASWDGHLIGRSFPRMAPMVSVLEDGPSVRNKVPIPVREPKISHVEEDEGVPGGSAQTREYYLDSSSSRRKSLDRSGSIRKTAAAVVAEIDELKRVSTAKVSPATTDNFHGAKVVLGEESLRDDLSDTFELSNGLRDDSNSSVTRHEDGKAVKKSKRWSWKLWGFIQRRKNYDDEECGSRANGVERSFSESWQDSRRVDGNRNGNNERGGLNRNMFRSNSSVSWRNGNSHPLSGSRKSSMEMNGKKRNEFVLEKNRSARYSPNYVDNGLLRFYLTPMRGSRRGGTSKLKHNSGSSSQSMARSIMQMY